MCMILESKWQVENGELIERNLHDLIRGEIVKDPDCEQHLSSIEKAVAILREKGHEIIYSLKIKPK